MISAHRNLTRKVQNHINFRNMWEPSWTNPFYPFDMKLSWTKTCITGRKKRRREKVKSERCVKVTRTSGISGCMTSSLAHLASGYEVGSCTASAAGAAWVTLRCRPLFLSLPYWSFSSSSHPPAQLSSFTIMYDCPLRTGPSGSLAWSR